ncbi:hypothetical protein BZA77DRAFT_296203 [Pyronema omphalodes]|nr:hypothetical protein BZA77DRAFT_296203 [Pyronema omphalodes]
MPNNWDISTVDTNAENGNGLADDESTESEADCPTDEHDSMEIMPDPWAPLRDSVYNPQNISRPPPAPRNAKEAIEMMIHPLDISVYRSTSRTLPLARNVTPLATEICRDPRPDGPVWVDRETLSKVIDECTKMVRTTKMLEKPLRDARAERDYLYAQLKTLEQKLKDQTAEFEHKKRHQKLIAEAIYGADYAKKL